MGFHDDGGKRTWGVLDGQWTENCSNLMCSDSRLLLQFDKTQVGSKLIFGNDRYVLNPV